MHDDWRDRVRHAFREVGAEVDTDILDELAQHAESTYAELRAGGTSGDAAVERVNHLIDGWRRNPSSLHRVVRRAVVTPPPSPASLAAGTWADALYGLRLLRARPGYAALTIVTIALGVAAVTTLFSVANGVLLRPLPWAKGEGLVRVVELRGGREGRVPGTMMNGTYLSWNEAPQTIEQLASWTDGALTLTGAGDATRLTVTNVSPSMFAVLRATPLRGRFFLPEEGRDGNWHFAILSEGLWRARFGAREDLVGQTIVLDGSPCQVVGVMPADFQFPTNATQAWLPMSVAAVDGPNGVKRGQIFRALARLKPGVTAAQASAEATARAIAAPDAGPVGMALFGAKAPIQVTVVDANELATADVRPAIIALLIATALLFATAVANVANMQLSRALTRHREFTIRAALGAGSGRLSRQLLIESAIVSVAGAAAGLLLSVGLHRIMPSILPSGFPRPEAIAVDARVLTVALALSIVTSLAAGVLPLLYTRRLDVARALSQSTLASAGDGRSRVALTRLLVVASQVAVTVVLVVGAMLLSRSFLARAAVDRGYDPSNVITATVPFPATYTFEQRQQARGRIVERIKAHPGITHAAFSTGVPLISAGGFTAFTFTSPLRDGVTVEAESIRRLVTPDYFGALQVRIRAGRPITDRDVLGSPTAIVVNRSFVRKYLDDVPIERAVGLAIGQKAVAGTQFDGEATIVGVVDDLRQDAVDAAPQPEMFVAIAQLKESAQGSSSILIVRTVDDPSAYIETLRGVVREIDSSIALDGVMTMEQRVNDSVSRPRVYALLLGGFALFAILIAGAGLFGVLSHSVTQRSREMAVRTALGASRASVVAVALKQMGAAMIAGVAIGLAASAALSTSLAPFIYAISTRDWLSFAVAPLVLLTAGALACVVPARRVALTDPVQVLREI